MFYTILYYTILLYTITNYTTWLYTTACYTTRSYTTHSYTTVHYTQGVKKMHIYAIINQKGGVGKSTTAAALWSGLSLRGVKTLAVDLDPQANLSFITGAETGGKTALSLLTEEAPAAETVRHLGTGDIIPASKNLAGIDAMLDGTGREYRLKQAIEPVAALYDYIIIDTPPQLGITTINALTACNSVIIPAQADILSLQGTVIEFYCITISVSDAFSFPRTELGKYAVCKIVPVYKFKFDHGYIFFDHLVIFRFGSCMVKFAACN